MVDIVLKIIGILFLYVMGSLIYGMLLDMVSFSIVKSRKPSDITLSVNAIKENVCIEDPTQRETMKKWAYDTISNVVITNAYKCHRGVVYWRISEVSDSPKLFKNYRLNVWVIDNKTAAITTLFPHLYTWLARERFGYEALAGYGKIIICH